MEKQTIIFIILLFKSYFLYSQWHPESDCDTPSKSFIVKFYRNCNEIPLNNHFTLIFTNSNNEVVEPELLCDTCKEKEFTRENIDFTAKITFKFDDFYAEFKDVDLLRCTDQLEFGFITDIDSITRKYSNEDLIGEGSDSIALSTIYLLPCHVNEFDFPDVKLDSLKSIYYLEVNTETIRHPLNFYTLNYK